ncbi:transmembrane amino acid transporter protein-domain-containing protein [Auriculariales sp. MPI-PUGE-AT-0066]|nr:transmembrane amino acid transporter protein-domain-containing protein [Auriculariales sp. MPI-PUGE-AT-0066]
MSGSPSGTTTPASVPRNIPARLGRNVSTGTTPLSHSPLARERTPGVDVGSLAEEDKAKILRKHLVSREERGRRASDDGASEPGASLPPDNGLLSAAAAGPSTSQTLAVAREDSEPFPVPFHTEGGDITRDLYKWQSDQRRETQRKSRSQSVIVPKRTSEADPAFEHIHEPGGLRRNYVLTRDALDTTQPVKTNNFVEFLYLYGHLGGEELEEIEDEDDLQDEEGGRPGERLPSPDTYVYRRTHLTTLDEEDERRPLLKTPGRTDTTVSVTRSFSRLRRRESVVKRGDATITQAVLMLLKSFIGTGVLFLGKAFYNGGMLFSTVTLVFIAMISLYSFLLLGEAKAKVPGSFGSIGGQLYGRWMRLAILASIFLSQVGFVAAYTIFVAENLRSFILAVTDCKTDIKVQYLILLELVVFLPLALVRNLAKLSTTALVADVFILIGLVYIASYEVSTIATKGIANIKLFNPNDFALLIGTAVFSFEGIGLVIPITDAMAEPEKFPRALIGVMFFLTFLFGGAGVLSYAAFGSDVQTVILVNLPSEDKFVQVVQFIYAIAILLSIPLQFFPAARIVETGIFKHRSGKLNPKVKWQKNGARLLLVLFCTLVSIFGAQDLDKFVAFVGSFACVPLCYVYPAMLHYRACARTRTQKAIDIALMIFGVVAAVYTTAQTIKLMLHPSEGSPAFGVCDV